MPINKERMLNIGLIALACLISFGLGHWSFASGVEEANRHAEELARIDNGEDRPSVFWSLAGLGVVFVLAALAWVLVARTVQITPEESERLRGCASCRQDELVGPCQASHEEDTPNREALTHDRQGGKTTEPVRAAGIPNEPASDDLAERKVD